MKGAYVINSVLIFVIITDLVATYSYQNSYYTTPAPCPNVYCRLYMYFFQKINFSNHLISNFKVHHNLHHVHLQFTVLIEFHFILKLKRVN